MNLHDNFRAIRRFDTSFEFLWTSERTGGAVLYVRDTEGNEKALSPEGIIVEDIAQVVYTRKGEVDEAFVYFWSPDRNPMEKHLCCVGPTSLTIDASKAKVPAPYRRVSQTEGTHYGAVSPKGNQYVDVSSALERPLSVYFRDTRDGRDHFDEKKYLPFVSKVVFVLLSFFNFSLLVYLSLFFYIFFLKKACSLFFSLVLF